MSKKDRQTGISRREFIKGAAAGAAGLAAMGLFSACSSDASDTTASSSSAQTEAASDEALTPATSRAAENTTAGTAEVPVVSASEWSWETVPDDIDESLIKETVDTDVLVVGCGFAGLCASLSAKEQGADVICIEKSSTANGRGGHITAFGSRTIDDFRNQGLIVEDINYAQIVRRWIYWAQGRVKEELIWEFARKSGACMDWLCDKVEPKGLMTTMWGGYYKGPDYTEMPVTHYFYDDTTDFIYLNGVSHGLGMSILIPALVECMEEEGVDIVYDMPCVRLIREGDAVTGVLAGDEESGCTRYNAQSVIIASGDYTADEEMVSRYNPFALNADDRLYIPLNINSGDLHKQAMWVGGAMQKSEPHAAVIHLESGAQSYNFLHVNDQGKRFMNEDVNTQSKSCVKEFQGSGLAYTIYDSKGLEEIKYQVDNNLAGGISCGQQYMRMGTEFDMDVENQLLEAGLEKGTIVTADTISELADLIGVPAENLEASVARYNELAEAKQDADYGKRSEILNPISEPPFYAGKLVSTLLTATGGLRTDENCAVLDKNDTPIPGLYVCGSAAGDFFANDYPTICPGVGHGRCLTFGRIAGIVAAGGSIDDIADIDITMP